jgi:hypothetical protein
MAGSTRGPREALRSTQPQADAWDTHLHRVEAAIARRDARDAKRAWRHAYGAAWSSPSWRGLADVGDASMRIGELTGSPTAARRLALAMYSRSLIRARRQRSYEGLRRLADAFATLGDEGALDACLRAMDDLTRRAAR